MRDMARVFFSFTSLNDGGRAPLRTIVPFQDW